jgi:hypothetical protein
LAPLETAVTLEEETTYISEYGMSDGTKRQDHDDDGVGDDIPRPGNGPEDDDDGSDASEHNPDEIAGAGSERLDQFLEAGNSSSSDTASMRMQILPARLRILTFARRWALG